MTDDRELLRRFAEESSQEAFTELVGRHVGLVYHAALRQCGGDAHRAEDVAQSVFAGLACKARRLARHPALVGWLHTSTRHAAAQAVRSEVRRQAREQASADLAVTDAANPAADWDRLKPVIDEALFALGTQDREAILLRYFEQQSYRAIAARADTTEDGARMRVERALEKLRATLTGQGITSTAAALGTVLEAHAAGTVPSTLTASVTTAALAKAATVGAVAGVTFLMSITKLQIAALAGILAAGSVGLVWQHERNVQLSADLAQAHRASAESDHLRAENARLTQQVAASSPGSASPSIEKTAAPAKVPTSSGSVPLAAGLTDVAALGNAGRATARAAWMTQLWAARTGDIALEASTLLLSPEEKAELQDLIASLPADLRAQYGTPEQILAYALAGSPHPVGGMEILGETTNGPDDVTLQTQWQHADDDVVHQNNITLHQEADGWKMVVPPVIVKRAAAYLGRL
jgi:RNA polymerase sigma factor (sigma-70 family)